MYVTLTYLYNYLKCLSQARMIKANTAKKKPSDIAQDIFAYKELLLLHLQLHLLKKPLRLQVTVSSNKQATIPATPIKPYSIPY
jgi:hypothetical protein